MGFLGEQPLDKNGDIILEWMNSYDLTMLNAMTECEGAYTWTARGRKSVIDYCVASSAPVKGVSTDGDKDILDLSDHNLITVTLRTKLNINTTKFKHVVLKNLSN